MARQPYRPMEAEPLRPVASPVDTFVRAQEPSRDTNLQDLARSLSGLGGSLAGMVGERDKKAEADDELRGKAAFWQSNGTGAAAGIASGAIPAQASPSFMRGYKQVEGEVAGGQLEQKFAAAYDQWEGKSSTDPKAYDAFVGGFIKDSITTTDPDVLRGLIPKVHQVAANYLQRHISDASKATMQGAIQASAAKNDQAIEVANSTGLASKQGTDYEGVFKTIEANREGSLRLGMNREQYDQTIVDGVTASAIKLRDPKILSFLDRKVPGTDYTWGNTPYGRDQRQKTIDTLESMGRKSIADDEKKNREEKAATKDDVTRRTIQSITKSPNDPIPEDLLAAGEKVDPDFRVNAIRWRDTIGKGTQTSDPEEMLAITTDIINGGGLERVQRGIRERAFRNPEDLTKAFKLAESMKADGGKLDAITKLQSFKDLTATIKKRTAREKSADQYFDDGSFSQEGLQAMTDLRLQMLQWAQKNPSAGPIEQEEAVANFGASLLKRIQQPEVQGAIGYDREGLTPPNAFGAKTPGEAAEEAKTGAAKPPVTKPNPFSDPTLPPQGPYGEQTGSILSEGVQPSAPQVAPPSPPAPKPAPVAPAVPAPAPAPAAAPQAPAADAGAWFNSLPEAVRSRLEMKAAQAKMPLSLKVQELYQKGIETGTIKAPAAAPPGKQSRMVAPDGTPIETASVGGSEVADGIVRAFEGAVDAPPQPDTVRLIGEAFERAVAGKAKPQGGYASASLKDDPKAARILDFVAGPESGGNYNAYFGNGRSTKDLSAMTLDQVMAWSGNRGTESSATGRYQFMAKTLRGLKQEMGLKGSEPFSPELQDRMALQLLNRRGYSEWQAGRINDAQFANRLALEWASLPNITAQNGRPAGVSAYAGDGLNKSLVSPASVLATLTAPDGPAPKRGVLGRLLSTFQRKPPADSGGTRI